MPVLISGKYIYNLVTKKHFWSKPILKTLKSCIKAMRIHAEMWGVKAVCLPRLGAGLDLFNFARDVLPILTRVFEGSQVTVYVYSLSTSSSIERYVVLRTSHSKLFFSFELINTDKYSVWLTYLCPRML